MAFYSERTMRWFHQSYEEDEATGCLIWRGCTNNGKAVLSVGGRSLSARRAAYAIAFGEEPSSEVKITLSCEQRLCVNVEHFVLTRTTLLVGEGEKYCSRCKQVKPLAAFSPCSTGAGGVFNYCRVCFTEYKRHEYDRDPLVKERSRLRGYGLTTVDFARMLDQQNGGCAICGGDNGERPLAVDHDGATGRVRSLLCNPCNSAIALLRHDLDVARAAVAYLESWTEKGAVVGPDSERAHAVLGEVRAAEVKTRLANGEPAYRLAKEYGVAKKAVSDLRAELWHEQKATRCGGLVSTSA